MKTYNFTLILNGPDVLDDDVLDAVYEAGCSDAIFGRRGNTHTAEFDREATSFSEAVLSAIYAIERAVDGLCVVRVEPDDLVTAAVIAERAGRTPESVRLLITGDRGPGNFPEPLAWVDGKTRLWQWSDVARWLDERLLDRASPGGAPEFASALNGALEARRQIRILSLMFDQAAKPDDDLAFTKQAVDELSTLVRQAADALVA